MDPERLELYDLLRAELRDETARKLVLALPPSPEEIVTRDYLDLKLAEVKSGLVDQLTWRMITIMGAWTVTAIGLFTYMSELFK